MSAERTGWRPRAAEHEDEPEVVEATLARPVEPPPETGLIDAAIGTAGRVIEPFARFGWRATTGIGRRLGVNQAVGRAVDRSIDRALQSDAAERAVEKALEADSVKRAWDRVLESDEAQRLVERVAEAPEVRSAITSQGVGLLEDVRRSARRAARRIDDVAERFARRFLRRPQRQRPIYAGAGTRLLSIVFDGLLLNGMLLLVSTLLAGLISSLFSLEGDAKAVTIAFGAFAWFVAAAAYLGIFWAFAERTPGMTFFGLRILSDTGGTVPPGQDIRRLVGFAFAAIPFGLGFSGIVASERRRGWHDRFAHTVVVYADPDIDPGVDASGHVRLPPA